MRVSTSVANILAESTVEGNKLFLPDRMLDRKLYLAVNKVLIAIKGKWNRYSKAHLFDYDPLEAIEHILQTGEYTDEKKEFQFFETPEALAFRMIDLMEDEHGETILEPSAGRGAIALKIPGGCHCIELNESNREYLIKRNLKVVGEDFLEFSGEYDIIIANPPFSKKIDLQQDIRHVNLMLDLAQKQVISIMSGSVLWRDNKKTIDFRDRVESLGGTIEELPEDSFNESGTKVNTCLLNVIL